MLLLWMSSTPRRTWFVEAPRTTPRLAQHDVGPRAHAGTKVRYKCMSASKSVCTTVRRIQGLAKVVWNAVITMIASAGFLFLVLSWVVNRFPPMGHSPNFVRAARFASVWLVISICCHCLARALQKRSLQKRGS